MMGMKEEETGVLTPTGLQTFTFACLSWVVGGRALYGGGAASITAVFNGCVTVY